MAERDELEQVLRRRNARLKAFADLGVPVEGQWEICTAFLLLAKVTLRCVTCDRYKFTYTTLREARECGLPVALSLDEKVCVEGLWRDYFCPHLAPLLAPDPPELETLAALAFVEGAA